MVARYSKARLAPQVAILQQYREDELVGEGRLGPVPWDRDPV